MYLQAEVYPGLKLSYFRNDILGHCYYCSENTMYSFLSVYPFDWNELGENCLPV